MRAANWHCRGPCRRCAVDLSAKEVKAHGLGKDIEGTWQPGDRIVIIEDLITKAGSILKSVERFRDVGMVVTDAIVLMTVNRGARRIWLLPALLAIAS